MDTHRGLLVVISSPSGGGKDTVIRELLARIPNATRNITTTSRPRRPGNKEGVDYYFISREAFESKIAAGDFVEYNEFAGNYYGTEKHRLEESLAHHPVVFTQVEVNGKRSFDRLGILHVSIFLLPESLDILRERIVTRGGVDEDALEVRLKIAEEEIQQADLYDFQITNFEGKLEETVVQIMGIIREHMKTSASGDSIL